MKNLSDLNMPNTQISSIRNAVAERMAHGLNAREIQAEMPKLTKPELIRVIMDLLVNHNTEDSTIEPQKLSTRQVATILFSLRYLENTYNSSGYVHSEHIEGLEPMNQMEISSLCEDLNMERITL